MTESTSPVEPPGVRRRAVLNIIGWLLFLLVAGIAWYFLLSVLAPARVDLQGARGTVLGILTPPLLLTVFWWTGLRRVGRPLAPAMTAAAADSSASPVVPAEAPLPKRRFRIGACSVMTPQGNAAETAEQTKARATVFKPDKAIVLETGNLAHAGMVGALKLELAGYPASTRLRGARVTVMLTAILDDIYAKQMSFAEMIEGPETIYWIVPQALLAEDNSHMDIFAAAWRNSEWRDRSYHLHAVPSAPGAGYALLLRLQGGIDDSVIPYTLVVAADSLLDSNELALDELFSSAGPMGYIPAEGAAGFLLYNPARSPQDLWANGPSLAPVSVRLVSSDLSTGGSADALSLAMAAAILAAATPATDVKLVISDTDHRVEGQMAVIGALSRVAEHLDPLYDRLSPMEFAGSFGAATDIIHVALAMELADADGKIVCTVCDAGERVASMLVLPA